MAVASLILPFLLFAQGANDPVFSIGTGANGRVTSSAMQLDGKVIIGGAFTTYNGAAAPRVARILRTGALDATFTPGTGPASQVNAVGLNSTGKVFIGGQFTTVAGSGRNRIARLNSDGTLDGTFLPGTGFNGIVTQLVVQPDDKVIVVGDFTTYNGTARARVARLNTDGTLDTGFTPGTGANFLVACVALQSDGKVLIGGYFNSYNGSAVIGLARLNSNGTLDTGFNFGGAGVNNAVLSLKLQADGKALVGGAFTTYNGTGRNRILRLNTNGSLDTGFNPGTGAGNNVLAIAVQSNGAVIVAGEFTTLNGVAHSRIGRMSANGVVDATWTNGANDALNTVLWIPEGRLITGGIYTAISGLGRSRFSRLVAQCTDDVKLTVTTDGAGSETSWEIIPSGYQYAAYAGSGLPSNSVVNGGGCLADGCYTLRVLDSGTNGINPGGYVLKSQNGDRIIDDRDNFTTGGLSAISGAQGGPTRFCIPIGTTTAIYTSRDKLDWVDNQYFVASADAAVSQVWTDFGSGSAERANTGYDFWFFDPNGGYTFVRQRRHSTSDLFGPANATRACHMRVNNWPVANQIPANRFMNVRVRSVLLGVAGAWGPAYQFKIDPVRAACPFTKLMDIPGDANLSCGENRAWGAGNYVHARPVSGANKYQFRFRIDSESFIAVRTVNTYFVQLNWITSPLQVGKTYQVEVRVSKDNGATWCVDAPTPAFCGFVTPCFVPWGDVCDLTITASMQGGDERMNVEQEDGPQEANDLTIWPNPSSGEALNLRVDGLPGTPSTLAIVVMDATGRMVHQASEPTTGSEWTGMVEFAQRLAPGSYIVQVAVGEQRWTRRLVIDN